VASEKKKKEKTSVVLPKAWQSVKHRNETAQARTNFSDTWSAIGTILLVIFIIFVLLGGISMTGALKFVFNWSHNVGETISHWIEGGSVVVNDDGVYYDPSGQKGDKIKDDEAEVVNPAEEIENNGEDEDSDSTTEGGESNENVNPENNEQGEVQEE